MLKNELSSGTACLFDTIFRRYLIIVFNDVLAGGHEEVSSMNRSESNMSLIEIDALVALRLAMKYKET